MKRRERGEIGLFILVIIFNFTMLGLAALVEDDINKRCEHLKDRLNACQKQHIAVASEEKARKEEREIKSIEIQDNMSKK